MTDYEGQTGGLSPEKRELLARLLAEQGADFNAFPLSFAQQRLWFLDQLEPGAASYNMPSVVRLEGPLDATALEAALGEVVSRHEALRTTFSVIGDEPVQVIAPSLALRLAVHDLTNLDAGAAAAESARLAAEEARRPFDLARGPLVRAALLRTSATSHVFVLVMHHIVSDGWSMNVLLREVAALYEAFAAGRPSPLPELPIQYADFAEWQRERLDGEVMERHLDYWRRQLGGALPVLELPADRPRPPAQTFGGASVSFELSADAAQALRELSRREGATLFMTLLAAFQTLLHRYTRQTDISVGVPVANRTRAEVEDLIGFFVNTLVLRADLSGDPTFTELLARVREVALEANAHQDVPFEKLVEALQPERDPSRNPLFQVLFALQNAPPDELRLGDVVMHVEEFDSGSTRFDVELHVRERGAALAGTLVYNTDLFDETTARRMVGHFRTLLEGVAADPRRRVSALPLLTRDERRQVLDEWNATGARFTPAASLHELFEQQVARTPDAPAVSFGGRELSFRELDESANRVARRLRREGLSADGVVGICLERSTDLMVAVLGVLKAGGAYLPLDPEYPRERLRLMLEDSRARMLLTRARLAHVFDGLDARPIALDDEREAIERERGEDESARVHPDNLAYVIYTSGSTGRPKGVAMPHRALVNIVQWQLARSSSSPPPRTLQFTSLSFDVSLQEIFSTWCAGACLVLVGEEERRDSKALLGVLAGERIERLFLPFVALHYLAEAAEGAGVRPASLREVITAGEQLKTTPHLRRLFESLPGCTLDNQYGPSEAHVVSAFMLPESASEWTALPPVGRPVANAQLYVLDSSMQPVPVGVAGELYIGGDCLARGYLGRAGATAEKFVPHPFGARGGERLYRTGDLARYQADGNVEFLGRADHQVKVRGFRIELGEIEAALQRHEGVSEAVVVAHAGAGRESRLVAYVQAEQTAGANGDGAASALDAGALRAFLRESLPDYMIPSAFVFLAEFPLTPSGKVDRKALPAPDDAGREADAGHVAPRTPTEELLAVLWADVLGVGRVGVRDNFFESGGHSLLATQLMSRVRETFGVEVALRRLFEEPTVEGLARVVEAETEAGAARQAPPLRPGPREGRTPLSFGQQRLWFMNYLGMGAALYVLPAALRLRGALDVAALGRSFNEVVRRHDILRTTFAMLDGEPAQVVSEFRSVELPLIDLSASPADEREASAAAHAEEEARRPFDLERGPLVRFRVLRLAEDDHVLLLTMHHIISDGWSLEVLMREVATLYAAFSSGAASPLAELPIQYADFTRWQREWLRGEVLEEQLDYWRRQLAGAAPVLELPADRPRPSVPSWDGARHAWRLSPSLAARLRELARTERVTLYMLLLAGFQTLLSRHTGQEDVSVGSPIAGRTRLETEPLIGLFINMLVMRSTPRGGQSFRSLLREVRRTALDAYRHQDLPFERLVDELQPERDLSHTPLFQVMFVMQSASRQTPELPGLSLSTMETGTGTARFDLTLEVVERGDALECGFEYRTELFDAATIARLVERFE
ncbi:MAG TPA: amino acid adenylation domain-containing protein, partial [Pyrinomonadaceae bacterium]|nr:amino acid adenylation domain-containing protein [Pyrinomonadaceae bacterium]